MPTDNLKNENSYMDLKVLIEFSDVVMDYIIESVNRKKRIAEIWDISIIFLYMDIVESAKSIMCLYESNNYFGIKSLTRLMLERYMYLIQTEKYEKSAKAYFYKMRIEDHDYLKKIISIESRTGSSANLLGLNIENISEKFPHLADPLYIDKIETEYMKCFDWNPKEPPRKWFNYNNEVNSIEKLCVKETNDIPYSLHYSLFSTEIHGTQPNKKFDKIPGINLIRISNEFNNDRTLLPFSSLYFFNATSLILRHYSAPKKMFADLSSRIRSNRNFANLVTSELSDRNKSKKK